MTSSNARCSLMQEQLRLRLITVALDLDPGPALIEGNAIQLEQVFINLLTNARDALADAERKEIKVMSRREGGRVAIIFADTGCGIPDELKSRIFDPFFTTKEVGAGTGLGLSIAYGIVRDHHGAISLANAPAEGAAFRIELPLAAVDERGGGRRMSAHVLVVDDDPALLEALPVSVGLRMADVEMDTCDSGVGALSLIEETDYDAVITDIKMPGMDGLSLLTELRARRPRTPILLITGHGDRELAVGALRGGAFDFILKPIDRDYLVAALARAIEMRRLDRETERQQLALERHARVLEHIDDGVFLLDADDTIQLWNQAAQAITGLPAAQVHGTGRGGDLPRLAHTRAADSDRANAGHVGRGRRRRFRSTSTDTSPGSPSRGSSSRTAPSSPSGA